ncbi:MAG TPA: sigma-70 family RNA polymerase sigma factor [Tepidisphaeraceae bacterium]|nr:sigma-70 family RNA polymerase sigma factor [Tepidisphaeraceae bacterium]
MAQSMIDSDEAFADLVRRYIDLVYSAARRQVIDPGLAEDVTQAVFIIFHRKLKSLRAGTIISAWLLTTTHLCARDALKRRARRDKHERRAAQMIEASRSETSSNWDQISPELDRAMARLSRGDRNLLVLRFWDQKSHREIGDVLGISENAVTKRTIRALEKLKDVLLRSGAVASTQSLPGLLGSNVIQKAPAHLFDAVITTSNSAGASGAAIAKGGMYLMATSKIKVAAAVLGTIALATTIAIPLARQTRNPQPATVVFTSPVRPLAFAPPATTQSANAADSYAEALKLFRQLSATPADIALFGRYDDNHRFDDQAGPFFERYGMIVSWVRLGAAQPSCDWGPSSVADHIPVLNDIRATAIFMNLHALYAEQMNDELTAADDLVAMMAFGRHIGIRGTLVDKLVGVAIEKLAMDELDGITPSLSVERVHVLREQLDHLPKALTGKQLIQTEHDLALQMAKDQNQLMQVAAINSMDDFYRAIGEAMDQPSETFDRLADEALAKLPEGAVPQMLANTLVPSLKRVRSTMTQIDDQYSALRDIINAMIPNDRTQYDRSR